jgi:hypothetical protein
MARVKSDHAARRADKLEHTARAKALAEARRAVRKFVRVAATHEDFLDFHAPESHDDDESIERAFHEVERALWRSEGWSEPPDALPLIDALFSSVPERHRERVAIAFRRLEDATVASSIVREQAAYMIGRAMGRRIAD